MLKYIKRLVVFALLASPLTFLGQGKDDFYFVRGKKDKPITRIKENFDGKPNSFTKRTYILASVGPAILNGDNSGFKMGYNGNIGLSYQINKTFAIEGTIGYASLNGESSFFSIEELNFIEMKLNLMVDLSYVLFGPNSNRKFNIYPHLGLGQVQSKASIVYNTGGHFTVGYDNDNRNNHKGGGINGRNVIAVIPVGVDLAYSINNYLKLHLDIVTNYADSDILDVVPIGLVGTSGNSNDWYSQINLRVQFKFNKIKRSISACDCTF